MATTQCEQVQVVGEGRTQLLFETVFKIKPPMSKPLGESYDVQITDQTIFNDRVLIKGTVEKTLYYQHPHGKKGNSNQKGDNNQKGDQSDNNEEENKNVSSTSASKKTFRFLGKKNKNSQNKDQSDNKEEESKNNSSTSAECKCLNGSGQVVDSSNGIVHFIQQVSEFTGTVEIPGITPSDFIHVRLAEVTDYDPVVAMDMENTDSENSEKGTTEQGNTEKKNNGLIYAGKQMFKIDIVLVATRTEQVQKIEKRKKKSKALPLKNTATK